MTEPLKTYKISNEVIENGLARVCLSAYESQILWAVWRKTYAWRKEIDAISLGQFAEMTGISRRNVFKVLRGLVERKIIIKEQSYISKYGFNKNCQEWVRKAAGKDKGVIRLGKSAFQPEGRVPSNQKPGVPSNQKPTKKRTITKNILCEESLSAFINTLDVSVRVGESFILFIDKVRQGNKSNQIAPGRVERIIEDLLDISGMYGEHNLITALQRTLQRDGFNFSSRNVTGYPRQIAKSLYEQNRQSRVEQQSQAEKQALRKAGNSKYLNIIKGTINE